MRVLLINTSERIGGAAIAASRLMESLKNHGIKAKLLVRDKQTDQISVVSLDHNWRMVWKFVWERIVIWSANRFNKKNIFAVDIANTGTDITSLPEFQQADVIHLHWINQGMLSLKNIEKILASGKPVVWTMHDMWPCTGICHHARECTHYQQECHNWKGIDYLIESCRLLADKHPELREQLGVVVFGNQSQQLENLLPFKVYPLNFVSNEHQLVNIYNAVDIFVTPSLEENLPNTIMEAMACGIPCVGFNVGGIPEMIDHLHNGYVAQYKSSEDFANGIYWTLTEPDYPSLSEQACRKAISHYSENVVAKKYIDLYNKVTGRNA